MQLKVFYFLEDKCRMDLSALVTKEDLGDIISVTSEGKVLQLEHESGDVFLDWDCLEVFLKDELDALE